MTLAPTSVIRSHLVRVRLRSRGAAGIILAKVSSVMRTQDVKLRTLSWSNRCEISEAEGSWRVEELDPRGMAAKARSERLARRVMLTSRIWGKLWTTD